MNFRDCTQQPKGHWPWYLYIAQLLGSSIWDWKLQLYKSWTRLVIREYGKLMGSNYYKGDRVLLGQRCIIIRLYTKITTHVKHITMWLFQVIFKRICVQFYPVPFAISVKGIYRFASSHQWVNVALNYIKQTKSVWVPVQRFQFIPEEYGTPAKLQIGIARFHLVMGQI